MILKIHKKNDHREKDAKPITGESTDVVKKHNLDYYAARKMLDE